MNFTLSIVCVFLWCTSFCFCEEHATLSLIEDFEENPSLGRNISVIVVSKDFTQMHRRKKLLEKKRKDELGEKSSMIGGRVMARTLDRGVIMGFLLSDDELIFDNAKWKKFYVSPSDISFHSGKIIISGGNSIEEIDLRSMKSRIIQNKYFRHLHSIEHNSDGTKCLIASTGLDLLIELDLETEKIVWDYCTWDHGINISPYGHIITRNPELAKELNESKTYHVFVDDPDSKEFNLNGVPTGQRPCHLNGGFYDNERIIGYTCGNNNLSSLIEKSTKTQKTVTKDLNFPHSFQHQKSKNPCGKEDGYMICDTKNGSIVFLDSNYTICLRLFVHGTSEMPEIVKTYGFEWTQFASILDKDLYSIVDSRRKTILLVDISKKQYRVIPYPTDLSIQEVLVEPKEYKDLLMKNFGKKRITEKNNKKMMCSKKNSEEKNKICGIPRPKGKMRNKEIKRVRSFNRIELNDEEIEDVTNIAEGNYFPLDGFMNSTEFDCVLEKKTLCDGSKLDFWKKEKIIRPIVLSTANVQEIDEKIKIGEEIVLFQGGNVIGVLKVEEIFEHDPWRHSFLIFGESLLAIEEEYRNNKEKKKKKIPPHPKYMKRIFSMGKKFVAGKIVTYLKKDKKVKKD